MKIMCSKPSEYSEKIKESEEILKGLEEKVYKKIVIPAEFLRQGGGEVACNGGKKKKPGTKK